MFYFVLCVLNTRFFIEAPPAPEELCDTSTPQKTDFERKKNGRFLNLGLS